MVKVIFIIACVLAFAAPFVLNRESLPDNTDAPGTSFPTEFEGRNLRDLGLSERETYFLKGFPGQVGRFTDGHREIIIRRVTEATRQLHPASDCFKAVGYRTDPQGLKVDDNNKRWACFSADRGDEHLTVCERIEDNSGGEWTDASSWYWSALGSGKGEWWAYTVAENQ